MLTDLGQGEAKGIFGQSARAGTVHDMMTAGLYNIDIM